MLAERGAEVDGRIPDTVQALIAARIDRLPRRVKAVLQRGAVMGRVFWGGALEALSPEGEDVEAAIDELVARELVTREARSTISGEQAFRFKHVLIRDVAYAGVSKGARAELHRRFAAWLHDRGADELVEIRAYHLDHATALAGRARRRGAAGAGRRGGRGALRGGQARARARGEQRRRGSCSCAPSSSSRRWSGATRRPGPPWRLTDLPAVSLEMEAVRAAGRRGGRSEARGAGARRRSPRSRSSRTPTSLARASSANGRSSCFRRTTRSDASTRSACSARSAGGRETSRVSSGMRGRRSRSPGASAARTGRAARRSSWRAPTVRSSTTSRRRSCSRGQPSSRRRAAASSHAAGAARTQGESHTYRGELDEAEELFTQAHELFTEAGATTPAARALTLLARVHRSKGDLPRAEKLLRDAVAMLKPLQDRGTLVETQRTLAQVLLEQGKIDEAERYALESRETVGARDMASRASTRLALGLVRAAQGRDDEAETLLREAVEILSETDYRRHEIELLHALAGFLRSRGRDAEAAAYEARVAELAPVSAARIA